jgi:hypothetical protein
MLHITANKVVLSWECLRDRRREARLSRTVPFVFSADDFTDIGIDHGAPVTEDYETALGRLSGEISWVRLDIGNDAFEDAVGMEAALAGRS